MTTQEQLEATLNSIMKGCGFYTTADMDEINPEATAAITALIQEARIEENVRLRRRYNGTNYEKLRATLNYRIEQLSGGSNND